MLKILSRALISERDCPGRSGAYKKKKPTEFRIVILSAEATGQQWRIVFFLFMLTRILGA